MRILILDEFYERPPNFIELANKIHWRARINLLSWLWDFNDMFDNHKIEQKFEDLVRDDWQSLRERRTRNKMSFDKIAELYSIWKSCGRKPIFNLQHYWIDSDFWKSIPNNTAFFKTPHWRQRRCHWKYFPKRICKIPRESLRLSLLLAKLWVYLIPSQALSCKFMMIFAVNDCIQWET